MKADERTFCVCVIHHCAQKRDVVGGWIGRIYFPFCLNIHPSMVWNVQVATLKLVTSKATRMREGANGERKQCTHIAQ